MMTNRHLSARAVTLAALVFLAVAVGPRKMRAQSQTYTVLHTFCAQGETGCPDGAHPEAPLLQASDGNFYGTTYNGGAACYDHLGWGCGTLFEVTPGGAFTTLHDFCSPSGCEDGPYPAEPLIQATDGNFYGTTVGANGGPFGLQAPGTAFKMTPSGAFTTLTNLAPFAALVQGSDGNFYGTTGNGGTAYIGSVFRMTPTGTLTTLYSFCLQAGCLGSEPNSLLVEGRDGNFYGTTTIGGSGDSGGTIFEITPSGTLTTLYNFCSQTDCADGAIPVGALLQGADGNLYGTTAFGGSGAYCPPNPNPGTVGGCGTVFKITPGGAFTKLYNFCSQSGCADGAFPGSYPSGGNGTLVQTSDGHLYGTTARGGSGAYCSTSAGCGVVFAITPTGGLSTLYNFCSQAGCADGYGASGLVKGSDGALYGTNALGGTTTLCKGGSAYGYGCGTVFRLTLEEEVSIDIKPGDPTNTINLKSHGVVPVAILGSATFDPMTVDPSTVTFAGAHVASRGRGALMTGESDVNSDGYPDLVLYFRTYDLQLTPSSTEAVLYGTTYGGQQIRGSNKVRIVPPGGTSSRNPSRVNPSGHGAAASNSPGALRPIGSRGSR